LGFFPKTARFLGSINISVVDKQMTAFQAPRFIPQYGKLTVFWSILPIEVESSGCGL
jgi:hypothetical protein